MNDIVTYANLGGTVVVVVLFLNYLTKRDGHLINSLKESSSSNISLAKALQKLTDVVERNSSANVLNTEKISEGIEVVKENTKNGKH